MVKLSRDTELSDSLNVLAANERELDLTLTTARPLRKPRTMLQTKQLAELRREVAAQIFVQLSERARRSFRGPVAARGDWLTDQGLDARDRPGRAPAWLEETRALDAADVLELDDAGPGCILVPAPPWPRRTRAGQPKWAALLERGFLEARSGADSEGPPAFRGPIALDIALRGGAASHRDVDNVAGDVLRVFSSVFAASRPQVFAYRVYRQAWPEADVRIRIMPAVRLAVLARGMGVPDGSLAQTARSELANELARRRRITLGTALSVGTPASSDVVRRC